MPRSTLTPISILLACTALAGGPATDSSTITSQGPRSGPAGREYLNAEGTAAGKYASFGIADFGKVTGKGHKLKLTLVQSNAGFTKDGPIRIYLCEGSAAASSLKFTSTPNTFGAESMHPVLLGSAEFKKGPGAKNGTGKVDAFTFLITPPVFKLLKSAKNLRIVLEPGSPTVAATYAGFGNKTLKHPLLEVVP